ncbi:MAG: ATP-binding protein [Eubacterium sp.]|nr:ATP-binding protein [Eubacterium sp.]
MHKLNIDAKNENLQQVMDFVDDLLESADCSLKVQMQIDLAVEEIFVNIANYAYGGKSGTADITVAIDGGEVTITFADSGTPYNPLAKPDPDITLSAAQRQIGGLGIFLVKKNMDSVQYEYKDGQNVFTITKKI